MEVEEIYAHDLIGGEPAWNYGFSGRDIDYFVVTSLNMKVDPVDLEDFLDNYVGRVIARYYTEKGKPYEPYNKIINHNLIEIHIISKDRKNEYGLKPSGLVRYFDKAYLDWKVYELYLMCKSSASK